MTHPRPWFRFDENVSHCKYHYSTTKNHQWRRNLLIFCRTRQPFSTPDYVWFGLCPILTNFRFLSVWEAVISIYFINTRWGVAFRSPFFVHHETLILKCLFILKKILIGYSFLSKFAVFLDLITSFSTNKFFLALITRFF